MAFDYVRLQCCRAPKAMEIFAMKQRIMDTSITRDIGFHEDTISDLRSCLVVNNAKLPLLSRYSQDEICEIMLRTISLASKLFGNSCLVELNAVAGQPGLPHVRLYQSPLPLGAAGNPVHRCLNTITDTYAVMCGRAVSLPATSRARIRALPG